MKIFFAILAAPGAPVEDLERVLDLEFGPLDSRLDPYDFTMSDYYEPEMGADLRKHIVTCQPLTSPGMIVAIKEHANRLELHYAAAGEGGARGRTLNIDPGYLDSSRVVLTTGKDFAHRLHLGNGIYGEVTLLYRRRPPGFEPLPWTYPDYRCDDVLRFFNRARELYRRQRKDGP